MSRVYLASALAGARICEYVAANLRVVGHEPISNWHGIVVDRGLTRDPATDHDRVTVLDDNLRELESADVVVFLSHLDVPRAAYAEVGYAIARGIPVVWVHEESGRGRAIFDASPLVKRVIVASGQPHSARMLLEVCVALEDVERSGERRRVV